MVRRHIDQKMKELKQEYWFRLRKGKTSALKGQEENAVSGEQKDSVQKEMLAVSVMMTGSMERNHNRPLLLRDRRHKMTEKDLQEECS